MPISSNDQEINTWQGFPEEYHCLLRFFITNIVVYFK